MQNDFFSILQSVHAANQALNGVSPQVDVFMKRKMMPGMMAGMFSINMAANCPVKEPILYDTQYYTLPTPIAAVPYKKAPVDRIPGVWNVLLSTNTTGTTVAFNLSGDHPPIEVPAIHQESLPISYDAVPVNHFEQFVNGDKLEIKWI